MERRFRLSTSRYHLSDFSVIFTNKDVTEGEKDIWMRCYNLSLTLDSRSL